MNTWHVPVTHPNEDPRPAPIQPPFHAFGSHFLFCRSTPLLLLRENFRAVLVAVGRTATPHQAHFSSAIEPRHASSSSWNRSPPTFLNQTMRFIFSNGTTPLLCLQIDRPNRSRFIPISLFQRNHDSLPLAATRWLLLQVYIHTHRVYIRYQLYVFFW